MVLINHDDNKNTLIQIMDPFSLILLILVPIRITVSMDIAVNIDIVTYLIRTETISFNIIFNRKTII